MEFGQGVPENAYCAWGWDWCGFGLHVAQCSVRFFELDHLLEGDALKFIMAVIAVLSHLIGLLKSLPPPALPHGCAPAEGKIRFLGLLWTEEMGLRWGKHVSDTPTDAAKSENYLTSVTDNNDWYHHLPSHAHSLDRQEYILIICCDWPKTWILA